MKIIKKNTAMKILRHWKGATHESANWSHDGQWVTEMVLKIPAGDVIRKWITLRWNDVNDTAYLWITAK